MNPYEQFEVDDFLQDDFFIGWVLHPNQKTNLFWSDWLMRNPNRQHVVEKARAVISGIQVKPLTNELSDTDVRSIIDHVRINGFEADRPKPSVRPLYSSRWLQAAAAVLIAGTAAFFVYRNTDVNKSTIQSVNSANYVQVNNTTNQSKLIRMADGSLAVLHPGSQLRYPAHFSENLRNVYLVGEAFFEVHKNPGKPFLVHSRDMVTRVLGTSFTVRAFENENAFKVVVNTGKVLVYDDKLQTQKKNPLSVTLLPNQEVVYNHSNTTLKKDTLLNPSILSKEVAKAKFTFNNAPLSQIINRLNKAYDIHIEYDEEKMGRETLTASLSDLPLDEKVKLICKAINVQYSFEDGKIRILNP